MTPVPPTAPLDAAPSRRGWHVELYLEHLAEAAALWEQRPADRLNPDLSWLDLGTDEARLEAHLDALVLGGDLALAVCRQQSLAGDAGERHAAFRVFCRQGRPDLVEQAVEATDPDDGDALAAMVDALVAEMPEAWEPGVWHAGRADDPRWLRLAAALAERRGRPWREALLRALRSLDAAPGALRAAVVRALGRATDGSPENALAGLLRDDHPEVRLEAGTALLRAGTPGGEAAALPSVRDDAALLPLLGLAGRPSAVAWLGERLQGDTPGAALPLGLLGDAAAVPVLVRALSGAEPEAAALALFVLTGADLTAETFVPDAPDDDERFADEPRAGDPPAPGAAPRGTTVVGLVTDPAPWEAWWAANDARFAPGTRYRLGWPAGPASEVASLASPRLPDAVRRLVADALVVRYRMPVAFDTEASVAAQHAALGEMRAWAESQAFVPGRWYVGGHYAGTER